jgi:hypothetical protein
MDTQEPKSEDLKADLDQLKKALDLQKEIASLRMEVALQLSFFRWVAWTVGVCLAILGFLGFKAWSDLTGSAKTLLEKQLTEMSERYSNLSRGFSLVDSGRSRDAIAYLTPLYEANRYDDPVVRSLLYALVDSGECGGALTRIKEIRQDNVRFLRFKDPMIFNTVAWTLRDCASEKPEMLQDMPDMLELTLKRLPPEDPERRYPLFNFFAYYFIKGDLQRAEAYLARASSVQEDYPDLKVAKNEPWFQTVRRVRPAAESEFNSMWSRAKNLRQHQAPKKK